MPETSTNWPDCSDHGEGGIFALLGLISGGSPNVSPRLRAGLVFAGILGAGLLYGDGIITPAISVLSAIEGLGVATQAATPIVLPLTCVVLFFIFLSQHWGTAGIGKIFGPVMTLWFASIAALGLGQILQEPRILLAIQPVYAYQFFAGNKLHAFVVFGSVVLCLTGAEALYADLGHFGRKAIRLSWMSLAFPALLFNYFGQGALLLGHPELNVNPFYGLVPKPILYPMVGLSAIATVIASQALISGVFSLTQQAIELRFCPRFVIVHTSSIMRGQIYMPAVNYALMIACLGVVIGFGESSSLAGAYGIAVTGTMTITSILYFVVITRVWKWSLWLAAPLVTLFLVFDLSYFGANLLKVKDGGWFTLVAAGLLTIAMTTWRKGRSELIRKLETRVPLELFLEDVPRRNLPRVPGTAVFMSVSPEWTSSVLLHNLKYNKILHEKVALLSILPADIPKVPVHERVKVKDLGQGFYRVLAYNGYMQRPNVPEIMKAAYYGLPANRVVEFGSQIQL